VLREILAVRQDRPELRRRWFQDEFFDLYTWQTHSGAIVGFQLCYDLRGRERAVTWHREHGFSHNRIDYGGGSGRMKGTPLLAGDGRFPHRFVRTRFIRHAVSLDAATCTFILDKMREFGRHCARGEIVLLRRARTQPPDAQTD
jgi:hypothetical protein